MDFISPFITPIIELVMAPIKKHMNFLVSSAKYVKGMTDNMETLNGTQNDIKKKLEAARLNDQVVSTLVLPWLKRVDELKEEVNKVSSGTGCFGVVTRYKAGKQSYYILAEMKELEENKSKIPWTNEQESLARVSSMSARVPSGTQSNSIGTGAKNNIESRDLIFKDAWKALQPNSDQEMIALCGMGGVGKTTMMEQLKKEAEDSKVFKWIVNVVLGENINPISLQDAIAQYIGVNLPETTNKDVRSARLFKSFEGMSEEGTQNILVIMDDVWKTFDLKDVGLCPLPKGAKLLFTSRFEYVCTQMGVTTGSIFHLRVLDEEEAKKMFFGTVGLSDGDDPGLQEIGGDIVKICGGLPIAIVTIAKVLRGNIKDAWERTLSNLQNHDLQDLDKITYRIFELSFNNLETEDDKAVFLLSGLFSEDFNISIEDLMMYGWGLKLFTKVHTLAEARSEANICVHNLIRANLLTESQSMGCVKIHDLTRAFILSNFSKVKQASIVMHDSKSGMRHIEDAHHTYERILLNCTDMSRFPADLTKYDNLKLLILMDGNYSLEFPNDFYKRMQNLEVVSYEGMHIPLLPTTFEHSTNLRTLCLHSCDLIQDQIHIIGSLSNLETLSFAYCGLSMLPLTIGKLKKLKLLDMTECVNLRIENKVFQNFKSLEELYMRASPGKPIRFTNANYGEFEILLQRLFALELEFFENNSRTTNVSLKDLKRFRISIGCELGEIDKSSFRNTLKLVSHNNELQDCNIMDLFEKTEELELQVNDMIHLQDVSKSHTFSQLRVLHVFKCKELIYLFTFEVASGLKKLEELRISQCPELERLVGGEKRGVVIFPKLKFMILEDLVRMLSLYDDKIEFSEMVELRLDVLSNITSIYYDNNMQSLLNNKVVIPKLEKLVVRQMQDLKQIWPCQISTTEKNNVSMLKEIEIWNCDRLTNLFPSNPLPLLNHLEEIYVGLCGSVEVLFNIDLERVHEMEGCSSRLRRIIVSELMKLKELWSMRGVNNSDIVINGFKSVEVINIIRCEGFTNLFTPPTTNFDLGALEYYNTYEEVSRINLRTFEEIDDGIEIKEVDDYIPHLTYPSYLLHNTHHLQYLGLRNDKKVGKYVSITECDGVEEVVSSRDDENEEATTSTSSHQNITYFPHLDALELGTLPCLKRVDDGGDTSSDIINTVNDHQFQSSQVIDASWSFCQYPKRIFIRECGELGSLIPWYAVGQMERLQEMDIKYCETLMEIFESQTSTNNDAGDGSANSGANVGTTLTIKNITKTTSSSSSDATSSKRMSWSFYNLIEIDMEWPNVGRHVIPSHALLQLQKLEKIHLKEGYDVEEVFEVELEGRNNNSGFDESQTTIVEVPNLTQVRLSMVNGLKYLWKSTQWLVLKFPNLTSVHIQECHKLEHVFTCSMVDSLVQLKDLSISICKNIEVIVKEEDKKECDAKVNEIITLPHLKSITLDWLSNLKGFCLGNDAFSLPVLDTLKIEKCQAIMVFTKGNLHTPKLGKYYMRPDLNSFFKTKQEEENTTPVCWTLDVAGHAIHES
ncbi:hypothetical protein SSX86_015860 [Deinandra increscens subsp. villosa]|uniref:NB-ARC domain-containing protein n=1 Tax=Deinandra increscens subsp. villosa TaxID=3103831 RepID=A0AAP0D4A2_9ASTR